MNDSNTFCCTSPLFQMELLFRLRTLHRELDHVQLFDWEITALYDFISRGGRIELSLAVKGSHVHLDQSMHWELGLDMLLSALALLSQLLSHPPSIRQGWVQLWRSKSTRLNSSHVKRSRMPSSA